MRCRREMVWRSTNLKATPMWICFKLRLHAGHLGFDAARVSTIRGSSTNSYLPWKKKTVVCLIPCSILLFSTKRSFIIAMASSSHQCLRFVTSRRRTRADLDLNPLNSAWVHCLTLPLTQRSPPLAEALSMDSLCHRSLCKSTRHALYCTQIQC